MNGTFLTTPLNVNEVTISSDVNLDALVRNYTEDSLTLPIVAIFLLVLVITAMWFSTRSQ